jgi:hypothetical protein
VCAVNDCVGCVSDEELVELWRPTGPEEMQLVRDAGLTRLPPRLPEQPIFHPVLNEDYAVRIAGDWNMKASGVQLSVKCLVRVRSVTIHESRWISRPNHIWIERVIKK